MLNKQIQFEDKIMKHVKKTATTLYGSFEPKSVTQIGEQELSNVGDMWALYVRSLTAKALNLYLV